MTASSAGRRIHKEEVISAPLEVVWNAWTTDAGLRSWMVEGSRIEVRLGGPYELYFGLAEPEGRRGSEGCTVLSFVPSEMLSFTWNFPPSIPALRNANAHTFVVLRFRAEGPDQTVVTLDQLGWQSGPEWDTGFFYFDRAWSQVLKGLKDHFRERPATSG